jgi:hypothetical protein
MGSPNQRLESVRALEYMVADVRPDLNVVVHDSDVPLPGYMRDIDYDLIVLGPTFLCNRYSQRSLKHVLSEFEFIKHSNAFKVALPQDDYDCSEILEDWLLAWNVGLVYTVCPEHWSFLYPRLSKKGIIRLGYTAYIPQDWIDTWRSPRLLELRAIDVSYRARKLPANFGSLGQLKWEIGDRFLKAVGEWSEISLDISVDPKDRIPGKKWHDFLENSKFCLTTASGSSLLDPRGAIRSCVNRYVARRPKASFDEIQASCFKGKDCEYIFTALSPRNLEAALAETVQIATPGTYSGLMQPHEHFVPLAVDCSNISEVLQMMADTSYVTRIRQHCKESLLSEPRLRRENIVSEIINAAENYLTAHGRGVTVDQGRVRRIFDRYKAEIGRAEYLYWRKRYFVLKAREMAIGVGMKRIRDLIVPGGY